MSYDPVPPVVSDPMILVVFIMSIIYSIQAGISSNRGELYRYPYTFRLIH